MGDVGLLHGAPTRGHSALNEGRGDTVAFVRALVIVALCAQVPSSCSQSHNARPGMRLREQALYGLTTPLRDYSLRAEQVSRCTEPSSTEPHSSHTRCAQHAGSPPHSSGIDASIGLGSEACDVASKASFDRLMVAC